MKKEVSLKIISNQYIESLKPSGEAFVRELELEDSVEILTDGEVFSRAGATYVTYNESADAGLEDSRAILKVKEDVIEIKRYGKDDDFTMDMHLEEGAMTITRYHLPMMQSIDLEVYTNGVEVNLDEEGLGTIKADYRLRFDEEYSRRTKLEVTVMEQ